MNKEVAYDDAARAEVIEGQPAEPASSIPGSGPEDAMGCHSGADLEQAARAAGQSELLDKLKKEQVPIDVL